MTTKQTKNIKLLTKEEAAEILRVSVRTLERYIDKGYLKPIKIGKAIRFPEDVLSTVQDTAA